MVLLEENRCCLTACGSGKIKTLVVAPKPKQVEEVVPSSKKINNDVKYYMSKISPTKKEVSSEVTSYFNLIILMSTVFPDV